MAIQKSLRRADPNAVLITQGSTANNEIFYLTKGTAVVEVDGNVVGTLNQGDWFGEMAAILGGERTATVRALTSCEALVFKGSQDDNLYDSIAKDPKMLRKLVEQLCSRIVETSRRHSVEGSKVSGQADRLRRLASTSCAHGPASVF